MYEGFVFGIRQSMHVAGRGLGNERFFSHWNALLIEPIFSGTRYIQFYHFISVRQDN